MIDVDERATAMTRASIRLKCSHVFSVSERYLSSRQPNSLIQAHIPPQSKSCPLISNRSACPTSCALGVSISTRSWLLSAFAARTLRARICSKARYVFSVSRDLTRGGLESTCVSRYGQPHPHLRSLPKMRYKDDVQLRPHWFNENRPTKSTWAMFAVVSSSTVERCTWVTEVAGATPV